MDIFIGDPDVTIRDTAPKGPSSDRGKRAPFQDRLALVVIGMHRSGTSAATRCLAELGAALPRTLMPPRPDNPEGFWESARVVRLNDALLAAMGSGWDDPLDRSAAEVREAGSQFIESAIEIVEQEFRDQPLFVLKDPRVSRLLPFWRAVFERLTCGVGFVLVLRDPAAVVTSLARRDGMPRRVGQLLWLRHVLEAELETRGERRGFLAYEDLLQDPTRALAQLGAELDLRWPQPPDSRLVSLLKPAANRPLPTVAEDANAELEAIVACVVDLLRAEHRNSDEAFLRLDEIRSALAESHELLASVLGAETRRRRTLALRERREARTELRSRTRWARNLDREVERLGQVIRDLQRQLGEGAEWCRDLERQIRERDQTIKEPQQPLADRGNG